MIRKIVLINPSPPSPNNRNEISLSLLSIGNYLTKRFPEINIEIIDFRFEKNQFQHSNEFKNVIASSDAIGITCTFSENYSDAKNVAKACRYTSQKLPIIVGGLHPSTFPEDFMNLPKVDFDYIVVGYGELAMEQIITNLNRHNFQRREKAEIIVGDPLPAGEFYPIFDWTLLRRYFQQKERSPLMYLKFSSGCTGYCRFCSHSGKFRPIVDCISPQDAIKSVHDALQFLISNGSEDISHYLDRTAEIFVGDEFFGMNRAWLQAFLAGLIEKRHELPFEDFWLNTVTRIDTFRESDMPTFDKARVNVAFGIESFDEKMLEIMKKTANPPGFLRKIDQIIGSPSYRLKNTYYTLLILFGFPGESSSSMHSTYSKLEEILEKGENPNFIYAGEFALYPTNEVWLNRESYINQFGTDFYFSFWWRESLPKVKQNIISPRKDLSVYDLDAFFFSKIPSLIAQSADKASQIISVPYFQTLKKSWSTLMDKAHRLWEIRTQLVEKKNRDRSQHLTRE